MKINKKISIIFLVLFTILSTAFATRANAETYAGSYGDGNNGFSFFETEDRYQGEYKNEYEGFEFTTVKADMRGRLIIESVCEHSYAQGSYVTLQDLHEFYDLLCCQKGTKLPSERETHLIGSNGDVLPDAFPYLDSSYIGTLLYKDADKRQPFPSENYVNLSLGYYEEEGEPVIATPKEAYILAEMVKELEGSVFYYDILTDENGNKVRYEGSLEAAEKFMIGDEELYIVEKEYVVTLPDGDNVRVEGVSDGRGGIVYKYKEGSYKNHYERYEGKLEWQDSKLGSGGTYPSFECDNSSYSENSGIVRDDNVVPEGTPIYITGSNLVVKDGDYYYRATVEGNNSYIQLAWWTTLAGSLGNPVADTAFSQEADAFEAYILQAAGVTSVSELGHRTEKVIDEETGIEQEIENAFDIKYEPAWITEKEGDIDYSFPTTVFEDDKQTLLVGPFGLDYIESRAQFGGRPEVEFAGITNMELFTDAQEEALEYEKDWEIVYLHGERPEPEEGEDAEENALPYPKSNEPFYIRLFDTDVATKITNIKVYFRYMNAAGSYQNLRGYYNKGLWEQDSEKKYRWDPVYDEETGEVVDWERVYDHTQYWLELLAVEENIKSQALALGIKGAKWYNYTELNRKVDIEEGKVVIVKELLDADGNVIKKPSKDIPTFTFEVTVDGAINSDTERLRVRAGRDVESQVYYWLTENDAPTYHVEEVKIPEGYELVSIENAEGTLKPLGRDEIIVKAVNKIKEPKSGYIYLKKEVEETQLLENEVYKDATFTFDVTVDGTFKYGDKAVTDGTITETHNVTVTQGQSEATIQIGPFYWYDEAPTFKVEEHPHEDFEQVSIVPDAGTLTNKGDKIINVTATNRYKVEKGSIEIIKVLEGSKDLPREYIESLEFTFDIKVDGYDKETITLTTPQEQDANGNWVWRGTSSEYSWIHGKNPSYTIEEVNVPVGTELVSIDGPMVLTSNGQDNYKVENHVINKITNSETGRIKITKKVDDKVLVGKDFKFAVTLTGVPFSYKGVYYESTDILQLSQDGANKITAIGEYNTADGAYVVVNATAKSETEGEGSWESDVITWYGDKAPSYKVEEILLGDDIASSVEPSEGLVSDAVEGDTVKVTAWNRDNSTKGGYIKIIKTLENAELYSVDYVKSLVFKFKISVKGYDDTVVSLTPKLQDNKWVWEYMSDRYSWKATESAPEYSVEEVELPAGTEFVNANGPEGATVSGKKITGTIKESISQEILITTDNSFINKLIDEKSGDLTIKKVVTVGPLGTKTFKFKVKLEGTFKYKGEQFLNEEVYLYTEETPLEVQGGSQVTLGPITWYGNEAPRYVVEEIDSDVADLASVVNGAGTIQNGAGATIATFVNTPKLVGGYFTLKKDIVDSETGTPISDLDTEFQFKVEVEGYEPYTITIKGNETYKSEKYKWYKGENAPMVKVTEIVEGLPEGCTPVQQEMSGQLVEEGEENNLALSFLAVNKYDPNRGTFKIRKVVLDEKMIDTSKEQEFNLRVKIDGFFISEDGESQNGALFNIKLKGGETYTSPELKWYGDKAPTVTVEEYDLPLGWQNIGISNNGASVTTDNDLEIVVTNELPVYITVDLTTQLGGTVWEDAPLDINDKNTENSVANGLIDTASTSDKEGEKAIPGVEVYVYKAKFNANGERVDNRDELATIYKDLNNTEVQQPIITDEIGLWKAPRVRIPTVSEEEKASGYYAGYDVVFVYDGQTYEPTEFLASAEGDNAAKANAYVSAQNSAKVNFLNNSHAIDIPAERDATNRRTEIIEGKTPIDGHGNTVGMATGGTLHYNAPSATMNLEESKLKLESILQTKDDDGYIYDIFKTKASTAQGGLVFPFRRDTQDWNGFVIRDVNTKITELGVEQAYWYEAVYDYCLHINLGLVKRAKADIGIAKDLKSATVTVNGKTYTDIYDSKGLEALKHKEGADYTAQLSEQVTANYELGLYKTDYYYRAEMYQTNEANMANRVYNTKVIDVPTMEDTEMKVELEYVITVYNESYAYNTLVYTIFDYYDASLGDNPVVTSQNGTVYPTRVEETNIIGSDGTTYNKLAIDGLDSEGALAPAETRTYKVKFTVDKATVNGVHDTVIAGKKANIAEIGKYAMLDTSNNITGKVDGDSAADNLNIRAHNIRAWYEDDTDAAPALNIKLVDNNRTISGTVWEDKSIDDKTAIGDGVRSDDEALIAGLTTQLVEKVEVKLPDGSGYEYDFIWPTSQKLNCLGGKSFEDLTGFDSTVETASKAVMKIVDGQEVEDVKVGGYKFEGVPTGNYVVRFTYGNDKTELTDKLNNYSHDGENKDAAYVEVVNAARAVKPSGEAFGDNEDILTANYDNDPEGATAAVYNGQDYKSTIYQSGNTHENGYINAKADHKDAGDKDSDAIDNEARRLDVTANSETITNENANVLSTANYVCRPCPYEENGKHRYGEYAADPAHSDYVSHAELYKDYYMFADTAKIVLNLDNPINNTIAINNIDLGLIERPETAIVLDKQISSIKLRTNDNRVIFDAEYDISYDLSNDANGAISSVATNDGMKYLVAKATLNNETSVATDVLQAISKEENKVPSESGNSGVQNFRFINVDDTILQGTTVEINYQLTALNVGEVDYTSSTLTNLVTAAIGNERSEKEELIEIAKAVKEKQAKLGEDYKYGEYLGTAYYTGKTDGNEIVQTRVRQIVDYVDTDAIFSTSMNASMNKTWKTTNATELAGNGLDSDRLLDRAVLSEYEMIDPDGVDYLDPQKHNIILSVDTRDLYDTLPEETKNKGNAEFEKGLVPYQADPNKYTSQLALTVTKTVSAQDKDLSYDNIAEIVKLENNVGRRDMLAIPGNANPKLGEFAQSLYERDSSATELVTFTPPTGQKTEVAMTAQILVVTIIALAVLVVGIVIIKKKVL